MAGNHTPTQLQQLQRMFLLLDQRGDAKIRLPQLGECLRILGANPSEASIHKHIQQLRACGKELVSFDDLLPIYENIMSRTGSADNQQLIFGLRCLDEQNTGYIPAARLRRIMTTCGERLTQAEMDKLLVNRVNKQGLVNITEFVHSITKSPDY